MPAPRLMLVSPVLVPDSQFDLSGALAGADIAAVILRAPADADERALLKILKPLVDAAQAKGAAALIQGAPDLVGKSSADGIHVLGDMAAREAAPRFKPEKIVGVGGLRTRDAAMSAGEINVDYVLFGDPGAGEAPPLDATLERLQWWAEIFTTPCVGLAETLDAVAPIGATGADFVAFGDFVWAHASGAQDGVRQAALRLPAEAVT